MALPKLQTTPAPPAAQIALHEAAMSKLAQARKDLTDAGADAHAVALKKLGETCFGDDEFGKALVEVTKSGHGLLKSEGER